MVQARNTERCSELYYPKSHSWVKHIYLIIAFSPQFSNVMRKGLLSLLKEPVYLNDFKAYPTAFPQRYLTECLNFCNWAFPFWIETFESVVGNDILSLLRFFLFNREFIWFISEFGIQYNKNVTSEVRNYLFLPLPLSRPPHQYFRAFLVEKISQNI